MTHVRTLVMVSLVAGLTAPVLAENLDSKSKAPSRVNLPEAGIGDRTVAGYTLVLNDSYGDGWNGGTLDVSVNGLLVHDDITILDGFTGTFAMDLNAGDLVETVFTAGGWGYECSYGFYDPDGGLLAYADGAGPYDPPPSISFVVGGVIEPEDPCEGFVSTLITLPFHTTINTDSYTDGDAYFTFELLAPAAIELNTCYDGTLIDADSYWWIGLPCDPEAFYMGYDDGGSNSQYGWNFCGNWETAVTFGCDNPLPAGLYTVKLDGYGGSFGQIELDLGFLNCDQVEAVDQPVAFELNQNVPNPFNPATTIAFSITETGNASLKVYDLAGHQVATLVDGMVEAGAHSVTFDGAKLSSGVYFYTLEANGSVETKKMVLMK